MTIAKVKLAKKFSPLASCHRRLFINLMSSDFVALLYTVFFFFALFWPFLLFALQSLSMLSTAAAAATAAAASQSLQSGKNFCDDKRQVAASTLPL